MGLFKNLLYYNLGKSLTKEHPAIGGIGMVMANSYLEGLQEQERINKLNALENAKNKNNFISAKSSLKQSIREMYINNKEFYGVEYAEKFQEIIRKIDNIDPGNYHFYESSISDFIKECEFHLFATSGCFSIIAELEKIEKEKFKEGFYENVKELYEKVKNSTFSLETIVYWQDFMDYCINNNINIVNYEETKRKIDKMLKY